MNRDLLPTPMPTPRRVTIVAMSWCLGLLWIAGCGSTEGPERVIVEGRVSFDGAPVGNGQIYFYPTEENPGPVSGGPIKDGKYVAEARGGVPIGKHRVEITGYRPPRGASAAVGEGLPPDQYIPEKFNRRTELTVVVEATRSRATIEFDLSNE